jgi:hypothetical protein
MIYNKSIETSKQQTKQEGADMIKFEAGKEYQAKLSGEVRDTVKIVKRTEKFATVEYWGKQERKKIEERNGSEYLRMLWEGVYAQDAI